MSFPRRAKCCTEMLKEATFCSQTLPRWRRWWWSNNLNFSKIFNLASVMAEATFSSFVRGRHRQLFQQLSTTNELLRIKLKLLQVYLTYTSDTTGFKVRLVDYGVSCTLTYEEERRGSRVNIKIKYRIHIYLGWI